MSSHLRDDPRNACCPLLDFLRPPMIDGQEAWLLVMPALRRIDQPHQKLWARIARGLGQLAVGLTFMHEQNVAHRDICFMNIMVDASAMIPGGWCPYLPDSVFPSEDQPHRPIQVIRGAPVKYYFIDFGASSMFSSFEARRPVVGRIAQNQTVPELSDVVPYDPFKLDVRMFGDLIKQLQVDHPGSLSFLRPIVQAMTPDDPDKRVTVQESETLLKQLLKQRRRSSMLAPLSRHNAFNLSAWIKYPFMVATSRRQAQAVI